MIQQTNPREHMDTQYPSGATSHDGPDDWGIWVGRRNYSLEVVQHPIRARMCGFGDKDRRPLAPAAVAKMVIRREDNTVVDSQEVDYTFFLVTVDLWSVDGKQEMNLVLHPSSMERYVPPSSSKSKRRGNSSSAQASRNSRHQTPSSPASQNGEGEQTSPTQLASPQSQNYYQQPSPDAANYQASTSYNSPSAEAWNNYPQAPVIDRSASYPTSLPSSHTYQRSTATVSAINTSPDTWNGNGTDPNMLSYRHWESDAYSGQHYTTTQPTSSPSRVNSHDSREQPSWQQQSDYTAPPETIYASGAYSGPPPGVQTPPPPYYPSTPVTPTQTSPSSSQQSPNKSQTYTRTLVGPLSANACRLMDEHRKLGIFFLFQDLSVRTEGTFRLRMRLMNVGAPPAPESGATRVHTDVSPILAQAFTEPFTVFSAKRFPGVPDPTAFSIALGNQGQKLPLRNRHNKRRLRGESDSDDAESDEVH